MGNWKGRTDGFILRNIIYLLYGTPSAIDDNACIFKDNYKRKEYIKTKGRKEFLQEHFAGYIKLSDVDNMAVTDLIGGKVGKETKGASAGIRKEFIELIRSERKEENKSTPLETIIQKNYKILTCQIYDKEEFYQKVKQFMESAKESDETKIQAGVLAELYHYIEFYLEKKDEDGYSIALTWLLFGALLQNRIGQLMDLCQYPEKEVLVSLTKEREPRLDRKSYSRAAENRNNFDHLAGRYPQVRDIFRGREDLIARMEHFFAEGKRVLFLEGIGGIGKSELAKRYALKHRNDYDTIIFAPYRSNLEDLICDPENICIRHLMQQKDETREQFFHRKLKILQDITDERTLLIIDNFDVDGDPRLEELLSGSYHVIFTTRNTHSGYHSIKVEAIPSEKILFEIFEKNYGSAIEGEDRKYIRKIFCHVVSHTYAIELIAKQMQASFLTAKQMWEALEQNQLQNVARETVEGGKERKAAFDHICSIFNISRLDETEKRILRYLSLMGNAGVSAVHFREWANLDSFELINSLIRKSWIRREANRKISLHPLVIKVVWKTNPPTIENCQAFLKKLQKFCYGAWERNYEENVVVTDNVLAVLEYFQNTDRKEPLLLWSASHYLWQVGKFEESIQYGHRFYDSSVQCYGEHAIETGFFAMKLGGCYFNARYLEESIPWYKKGLMCMLACGVEEGEDLAIIYEKVGRCYTWPYEQNFQLAEAYLLKSLELRQNILKAFERGEDVAVPMDCSELYDVSIAQLRLNESYMEIGRMYQMKGEFEKALECAKNMTQNRTKYAVNYLSGLAYGYYDQGVCYYHLGLEANEKNKKEKANEYFVLAKNMLKKALDLNLSRRGRLAVDCLDNEEYLADAYAALGQYEEALKEYQSALDMVSNLLRDDTQRFEQVQRKMEHIKSLQ